MSEHGKLGELIIESLQQALAHARGEDIQARIVTLPIPARKAHLELPPCYPPHRIREIRQRLSVTQRIFAQMFGVSVSTVRAWEQGTREPEGPASRLLQIADLQMHVFREVCGEIHPATPASPALSAERHPRAGWDEAFVRMAARGDDRLLDDSPDFGEG